MIKDTIGCTLFAGILAICIKKFEASKKHKDVSKEHKEEGEAILKGLKDSLPDYSEEDNILRENRLFECEDQKEDLDVNIRATKVILIYREDIGNKFKLLMRRLWIQVVFLAF